MQTLDPEPVSPEGVVSSRNVYVTFITLGSKGMVKMTTFLKEPYCKGYPLENIKLETKNLGS